MKISELIARLKLIQKTDGDIEVGWYCDDSWQELYRDCVCVRGKWRSDSSERVVSMWDYESPIDYGSNY